MRLSDICSAKRMKVKLLFSDDSASFRTGALIKIDSTQKDNEFLISQYGKNIGTNAKATVLCSTDRMASQHIYDLLDSDAQKTAHSLFSIEEVFDKAIEVQTYSFRSIIEYKTEVVIQVADILMEKTNADKLYGTYIWDELGKPAVFCLNYKNRKKQNADIRFLAGKRILLAHNTARGIIAESESYLKDRDGMPIDIYLAPTIRFVPESDGVHVNESLAADLDIISNPATYFARWEAYNILSRKLLEKESEEFGVLNYTSVSPSADLNGITFEFTVDEDIDESFKGKELGASAAIEQKQDGTYDIESAKPVAVGSVVRLGNHRVITRIDSAVASDTISDSGSLTLYTAGDRFIMKRRDAAKERMLQQKSPIKSIVSLIEAGPEKLGAMPQGKKVKVITQEFRKNFTKADSLNKKQIDAIEIALNSPDIALIQGPPGTGKTTVIKAICERFREVFEAQESQAQALDPDHPRQSPKILISSFQNEAVDNAISTPLPGDIPAYRKTAKRTKDSSKEQYQRSLETWYNGVCSAINNTIENKTISKFVEERNRLNDEYLSYKNSGETLEAAAALIRHYLSYTDIQYPADLVLAAQSVIHIASAEDSFDDIPDPIVAKLEAQRLDLQSFSDDGAKNAKRLLAHLGLRDDLDITPKTLSAIETVTLDGFSEQAFNEFTDAIEKLKGRFCKQGKRLNARDKGEVNACLVSMSKCFSNQYLNAFSDIESKKTLILSEFLSRLEQEYEKIVMTYSRTTAATCQTSLDLRAEVPQTFDLVIIDEAARANPLDLFIPMSMGKKIVLVGDHKQLPHMLEPDVIKTIMDDPKFKDLPGIEISLFERLFNMFSGGDNPKSIRLTRQYRMHPDICKFVSDEFYDGDLQTADEITEELRSSPTSINDGKALTFVNLPFAKGGETRGTSKSRRIEAATIARDVKLILQNSPDSDVGIITFYSAQAASISQSIEMALNADEKSHVEVGTVDAFQGKEFDYVLLSCVRSNLPDKNTGLHSVGFLEKPNRLCVAFSRAIRQLVVYGDAETLIQIPCFNKLFDICTNGKGCYRET